MADVVYTNRGFSRPVRCRILRLLLLGWSAQDIAEDCRISLRSAYMQANNLLRYGSMRRPALRKLGRPRKLTAADESAVLEHLLRQGWMQQEEVRFWVWCERGVLVSQSTVSRLLTRKQWSRKKLRWISLGRSKELRRAWREEMRRFRR